MPKREYNKIKSMTKQEMYDFYDLKSDSDGEEPYRGVYEFGEELYEFGKYTDFEPPKKSMSKFFKKKELQERYTDDYDFFVVTPEFLSYIIDSYRDKVRSYYTDMLNPFFIEREPSEFLNTIKTQYGYPNDKHTFDFTKITDEQQSALFKIIEHVRSMAREWGVKSYVEMKPYDLEKNERATDSWKYEYAIFELVRIYKSFDWKRNVMIYYGY